MKERVKMTPAQILVYEHGPIMQCLNCIEKGLVKIESEEQLSKDFWEKSIDFLRNYADKYHHAKEEVYFLPLVDKKGTRKYQTYTKVVFAEHEHGRAYIAEAEEGVNAYYSGDKKSFAKIHSNFTDYIFMLRNHINKENRYFLYCENEFLVKDIAELNKAFDGVDQNEMPAGFNKKYLALLEELKSFV